MPDHFCQYVYPLCFLFLFLHLFFCPQCSRSCGKGLQVREARCLTPDKKHSQGCDSSIKPAHEQFCNTIPCGPQVTGGFVSDTTFVCVFRSFTPLTSASYPLFSDKNCRDRRENCMMVVQARMCVYSYYKTACCASCAQSAQRAKRH